MIVSELRQSLRNLIDNHESTHSAFGILLSREYGNGRLWKPQLERLSALCSRFEETYGDGPVGMLRAPARINLLGEHVDYVSYIPTASLTVGSLEHDMVLFFRPAHNGRVRGVTSLERCDPLEFELSNGPPPGSGNDWESFLYSTASPAPHWGNYVKGSVYYARMQHSGRVRHGFDFMVDSTIPPAGGASSSSALTVLAGAAIRCANGIGYEPSGLALDSARAEWFVGTRGGSMDHLTICLARPMNAVHIAYGGGATERVPLTFPGVRWLTFFSHPANKGREVMLEYNERAAVSRIVIPALLAGWEERDDSAAWSSAARTARSGSGAALDELEELASRLPECITLAELEKRHPGAFDECRRAFPALLKDRRERPLAIRDRALHHIGEVRRVTAAVRELSCAGAPSNSPLAPEGLLKTIGSLLNSSHKSLRDLYGVSTPEVEQLRDVIVGDPNVYGARLMGGGFGGNVLALTTAEHEETLTSRVQELYYRPRGRDARSEHSVMVSTPGGGLSALDPNTAARDAVEVLNREWRESARLAPALCRLLDRLDVDRCSPEVWPVIVAAGKGARARASGLERPKPLAQVDGVCATRRVVAALTANRFRTRPPVVIASPETEPHLRAELSDLGATFVVQPSPLGTGDAVLRAMDMMKGFKGRALVAWGTQPVIRAATVRRSLRIAAMFPDYSMVLPTVAVENPYAPLARDPQGRVIASRESHIERAPRPDFAETNIGVFVLWSETMFEVLSELRRTLWREGEGRYDRPSGELGFPNEVITRLAGLPGRVLASPIADPREVQGIKTMFDIATCEQYIRELNEAQLN